MLVSENVFQCRVRVHLSDKGSSFNGFLYKSSVLNDQFIRLYRPIHFILTAIIIERISLYGLKVKY